MEENNISQDGSINEMEDLVDLIEIEDKLENLGKLEEVYYGAVRGNKLTENACMELSDTFAIIENVVYNAFDELNDNLKLQLAEILKRLDTIEKLLKIKE